MGQVEAGFLYTLGCIICIVTIWEISCFIWCYYNYKSQKKWDYQKRTFFQFCLYNMFGIG